MENQLVSKGITDGVYRLGDGEGPYNTYLMIDAGEGILIDPGSALNFERVFREAVSILPLEKIKHVIVHHQGPDCCAGLPLFEQRGLKATVVTHSIAADALKHYGVTSPSYAINEEGFKLTLASGRKLQFLMVPYVHLAGAMVTYDNESRTLFSSKLFGPLVHKKPGAITQETYLEQHLPRSEMMGALLDRLLLFDIERMAPQQGSPFEKDVKMYIKKLRDWDYGNTDEKKLSSSVRYLNACNRVIKRLYASYEPQKVAAVLNREGVLLDEQTGLVQDYYGTGTESWNKLFEVLFREKGIGILEMLEPLAQTIQQEDGIPVPEIMHSKLLKRDRKIKELSDKYKKLEAFNKNLMGSIEKIQDKFIRCPNTGLFNEMFFADFMKTAFDEYPGAALFLIDVDNLADIRLQYGTRYREETIKNLSYLLKQGKGEGHRLFTLHDAIIAYFIPETNRGEALEVAEQVRKKAAQSTVFRDKITLSIGLSLFKEIGEDVQDPECRYDAVHDLLFKRLQIAKATGNTVCGESTAEQDESARKKVLLVDTDDLNLDFLKSSLDKEGCSVLVAKDGVEALAITATEKISLIISELMLPKMDGLLFKENLSFYSDRANIPFILLSHQKDAKTVERALALQVNHYFKKPYMLAEVVGIAKNRLKGGA